MKTLTVNLGTIALAIDVQEEIAEAVDPSGPGGRKVTIGEALQIGFAVAKALLSLRGESSSIDEFDKLLGKPRKRKTK